MIPTFIVPHPSSKRAIVVLQSIKDVVNFKPAQEHVYHNIERDFRSFENQISYQILMKIFK